MSRSSLLILVILVALLIYFAGALGSTSGVGEPRLICKEAERQALLKIKEELHELEDGVLSSWGKEEERRECCKWIGIRCDNVSGHVIRLDLSSSTFGGSHHSPIRGNFSSSLVDLRYLKYLDLSTIDFSGNSIPSFIGTLSKLNYLSLRYNNLEGLIPDFFGNMTALSHLDLGHNQIRGSIPKSFGNMTAITFLDLHENQLEGSIPAAFQNIATLEFLDLSYNHLQVEISKCGWVSMENLHLDLNLINGPLPNFTLMPSLKVLSLRATQLRGNVPESIGQLSKLEELDISANYIEGVMSEAHFSKLIDLSWLNLSYNPGLVLNMSPDWTPPFQLFFIDIKFCKLVHFRKWIETQKKFNLLVLEMPNANISGCIPNTFWNFAATLTRLDLSNNEIRGAICDKKQSGAHINTSKAIVQYSAVDLSSNQLEGSVPLALVEVAASLNLSNNRLSDLNSLCNITKSLPLTFLDISYNQLSGEIPDCWSHMKELKILILENNKLSGRIPVSFGSLTKIESLYLGNNALIGEFPSSMKKLSKLIFLDVAENDLSGLIPAWIGKSVKQIAILSLRSNNFNGSIPLQLCLLKDLQVLDLSSNNLSSSVPTCLGDIRAMKERGSVLHAEAIVDDYFYDELSEVWKGKVNELKNLDLLKNMCWKIIFHVSLHM